MLNPVEREILPQDWFGGPQAGFVKELPMTTKALATAGIMGQPMMRGRV